MNERILIIGGVDASLLSLAASACMGNRDIIVLLDDPQKRYDELEASALKAIQEYKIEDICASSSDFYVGEKEFRPKSNQPFYRSLPKFNKRRKI